MFGYIYGFVRYSSLVMLLLLDSVCSRIQNISCKTISLAHQKRYTTKCLGRWIPSLDFLPFSLSEIKAFFQQYAPITNCNYNYTSYIQRVLPKEAMWICLSAEREANIVVWNSTTRQFNI